MTGTRNVAAAIPQDAIGSAAPIDSAERIGEVDIIRGFALFGVLWMNLEGHADFMIPESVIKGLPTAPLDQWIGVFGAWFAQGKAQCLFSLLFGFGFAILSNRADARGTDASAIYIRRILILMVVGFAHLFLLWMGDILHAYALMGLVLMLTRRWPSRALLVLGITLAVGAFTSAIFAYALITPPGQIPDFVTLSQAGLERRWPVFLGHDYVTFVREVVLSSGPEFYFTLLGPAFLGTILGRFLLGQWIFRQGWIQDTHRYIGGFRRATPWLLGVGVILAGITPIMGLAGIRIPGLWRVLRVLADESGQLVLALGYASTIVVLCASPGWRRLLSGLGAVGRMALTNYLTQSLVFFFVLYGFGLGWLRYAGPTFCLVLALGVFALQIMFSRWWLARYRFGPAEWLWRSATYGHWQPLLPRGTSTSNTA